MDVRLPRLLDAQLGEVFRLHPVSLSVEDNLTPLSTASMTLTGEEHVRLHDWLELYTDRGSAGIYRVRSVTETYTADSTVEMEHGACVLGDAILPGEGTLTGTPAQIVTAMLTYQTMKVGGVAPWVFGSSAAGGEKTYDYDGHNLLSALIEFLDSLEDYALEFDQTSFPWKVNIVGKEMTPGCEGRLSRNLRSVSVTLDDSELCTRIYCDQLDEPGYIDGPNASVWGVICKTISATEDVTQESLTSYIRRYLQDHKDPKVSIEIDADDFSTVTGEPIDRFVKGRLFRLTLPDYGVTMDERILSVRTGSVYGDRHNVRLTLANNIRDTSENFVRLENALGTGAGTSSTGRYVGSRGMGLSQTTVLDMLKKSDMYITADEAWTREAGVKIESNAAELYATKKSIFGGWDGDVETINALIQASTDNGGLVSMIVGRKNSVEDVEASIQATAAGGGLITMKASQSTVDSLTGRVSTAESTLTVQAGKIESKVSKDGVISSINQTPESVTINASRINLAGYVTASQLSAELANFQLTMNQNVSTNNLSVNSRAYLPSYVTMNSHVISMESIEVVTDVSYSMSGQFNVMLYPSGASRAVNYVRSVSESKSTIQYLKWN